MAEENRNSYLFPFLLLILLAFSGLKCSGGSGANQQPSPPPPNPVLEEIAIEGPLSVPENSSTDYKIWAFFSDGSRKLVDSESWSLDCPLIADITAEGLLTTAVVNTDEPCRISASYTEGNITKTDELDITILVSLVLEKIEISGPLRIPEHTTGQYITTAFFTDGSSRVVDPDAWYADCGFATISPEGIVTSTEVTTHELCRISASYTKAGTEKTRALDISISDQVIIDNNDSGATSTGLWAESFAPNPFDADSVESTDPSGTFTFLAPARKFYTLSIWWTVISGRCPDAEVRIYDSVDSIDHVVEFFNIDQTVNGGQWNVLGTYVFNGTAKVVLVSQDGCSTSADAVMFNSQPGVYYVAVGNSITEGIGDNDLADGFGFPVILEAILNAAEVYSKVANEGVSGHTSAQGLELLPTILARHPESHGFLVLYGTNDSNKEIPPATFKNNMQQIISRIEADEKGAYLAKLPIVLGDNTTPFLSYPDPENPPPGSRGEFIINYNIVIDELEFENNFPISPPHFWTYFSEIDPDNPLFKRYETQYADNLHPNEEGYRSMAGLWFEALTK
jgi:lysophospholipase L1-like esterase